jgi:hypothetical protein
MASLNKAPLSKWSGRMATYNTYTAQQERFLKENAPKMSRAELTELFNAKFHTDKTVGAIKTWCNSRGYNSANDGRFKDGHKSWQSGLKGAEYKAHFTRESFERGQHGIREANKVRKIGDEVIHDGRPEIVVSLEYGKMFWERTVPKARYVWEQAHGAIPKGHSVINLDNNPFNCELENLYCMPNKYKSLFARYKWWSKNAEVTRSALKWCDLFYAIKEMKKP